MKIELWHLVVCILIPACSEIKNDESGTSDFNTMSGLANVRESNTRIAFDSNRDGNWEIYSMNADGSDQRRLTNNIYDDNFPSWSPNSSQIVFSTDRDGNVEVYIMNPDGSGQRRVTNSRVNAKVPYWSPDGTRIIIESDMDPNLGGDVDIFAMDQDGSNQVRLTASTDAEGLPSWSPDGSLILFDWNRMSISVMNSDGTGQKIVSTPLSFVDRQPAYEDRSRPVVTGWIDDCIRDQQAWALGRIQHAN